MAGPASHVLLAVGKLGVDLLGHADHVPRDHLVLILIAGEIALHVAQLAVPAQCGRELLHDAATQIVHRQNLQILWRRRHALLLPILRRLRKNQKA